jgi:hypothetical protein
MGFYHSTGVSHTITLAVFCDETGTFKDLRERFTKIYRRKAHIHHYLEYMEEQDFTSSLDALDSLTDAYLRHESPSSHSARARMSPAV